MPSPVAHFLFGLTAHVATSPSDDLGSRRRTIVTVGAALAPDVDFVFKALGLAVHQGASHSVGAALISGAVVWGFAAVRKWPRPGALGLAAFLGWMSHVLIDLLNLDTHPPIGLLALWPFGSGHYKVPWPIFMDIGRTLEWITVLRNSIAVAWETALLSPLLVLAWRFRTRPRR